MTRTKHIALTIATLTAATLTLLSACTAGGSDYSDPSGGTPVAVSFSTYMARPTRAVVGDEQERTVSGPMTEARLRELGFGVFAFYTPNQTYEQNGGGTNPNFMCNQHVTWNATRQAWEYEPVKYWPNEFSVDYAADGQVDYVSFFAYAPYMDYFSDSRYNGFGSNANTGIIIFQGGNDGLANRIGRELNFEVVSNIVNPADPPFDLLGAYAKDQTKLTVDGRLKLTFSHVMAQLRLQVQGVFDDTTPSVSTDISPDSRIWIDYVKLNAPLWPAGNYYHSVNEPSWSSGHDTRRDYTIGGDGSNGINATLYTQAKPVYGTAPNKANIEAAWSQTTGVTRETVNLLDRDNWLSVIPNNNIEQAERDKGMEVEVKYYVVTRDPNLDRPDQQGYSVVTNVIKKHVNLRLIEAGKVYTLRLLLGLTTTKFDVQTTIEDWTDGGSTTVTPDPSDSGGSGGGSSESIELTPSNATKTGYPWNIDGNADGNLVVPMAKADIQELIDKMSATSVIRFTFTRNEGSSWEYYINHGYATGDGGGSFHEASTYATGDRHDTEVLKVGDTCTDEFVMGERYETWKSYFEGIYSWDDVLQFLTVDGHQVTVQKIEIIP